MPDMLVKLYRLPALEPYLSRQRNQGIEIRRAIAPELHLVLDWVHIHFGAGWASECAVALNHQPVGCFIAVQQQQIIGFGCHDATCRNFFGPTGVSESARGKGTGAALLVACLHAMAQQGYCYAIIGGVGPAAFYSAVVGATTIDDSDESIYRGMVSG